MDEEQGELVLFEDLVDYLRERGLVGVGSEWDEEAGELVVFVWGCFSENQL